MTSGALSPIPTASLITSRTRIPRPSARGWTWTKPPSSTEIWPDNKSEPKRCAEHAKVLCSVLVRTHVTNCCLGNRQVSTCDAVQCACCKEQRNIFGADTYCKQCIPNCCSKDRECEHWLTSVSIRQLSKDRRSNKNAKWKDRLQPTKHDQTLGE